MILVDQLSFSKAQNSEEEKSRRIVSNDSRNFQTIYGCLVTKRNQAGKTGVRVINLCSMNEKHNESLSRRGNASDYEAEHSILAEKSTTNSKHKMVSDSYGKTIVDSTCRAEYSGGGFTALEMVQCAAVKTCENLQQYRQLRVNKALGKSTLEVYQSKPKYCISLNMHRGLNEKIHPQLAANAESGHNKWLGKKKVFQLRSDFECTARGIDRIILLKSLNQQKSKYEENSEQAYTSVIKYGVEKCHKINKLTVTLANVIAPQEHLFSSNCVFLNFPSIRSLSSPSTSSTTTNSLKGKANLLPYTHSFRSDFQQGESDQNEARQEDVQLRAELVQGKDFAKILIPLADVDAIRAIAAENPSLKNWKICGIQESSLHLFNNNCFNCKQVDIFFLKPFIFRSFGKLSKKLQINDTFDETSSFLYYFHKSGLRLTCVVVGLLGVTKKCVDTSREKIQIERVHSFLNFVVNRLLHSQRVKKIENESSEKFEPSFIYAESQTLPFRVSLGCGIKQYSRESLPQDNLLVLVAAVTAGADVKSNYSILTSYENNQRIEASKDLEIFFSYKSKKKCFKVQVSSIQQYQLELLCTDNKPISFWIGYSQFLKNFIQTKVLKKRKSVQIFKLEKNQIKGQSQWWVILLAVNINFSIYKKSCSYQRICKKKVPDIFILQLKRIQGYNEHLTYFVDEEHNDRDKRYIDIKENYEDVENKTNISKNSTYSCKTLAYTCRDSNEEQFLQVVVLNDSITFECNTSNNAGRPTILPSSITPTSSICRDEEVKEAIHSFNSLNTPPSGFEASKRLKRLQQHFRGLDCMLHSDFLSAEHITTNNNIIAEAKARQCSRLAVKSGEESLKTELRKFTPRLYTTPYIAKSTEKQIALENERQDKGNTEGAAVKAHLTNTYSERSLSKFLVNIKHSDCLPTQATITSRAIHTFRKEAPNKHDIAENIATTAKEGRPDKNTNERKYNYTGTSVLSYLAERGTNESEEKINFKEQFLFCSQGSYLDIQGKPYSQQKPPLSSSSPVKQNQLYVSKKTIQLSTSKNINKTLPRNLKNNNNQISCQEQILEDLLNKSSGCEKSLTKCNLALQHIVKTKQIVADNLAENKTIEKNLVKTKRETKNFCSKLTDAKSSAFVSIKQTDKILSSKRDLYAFSVSEFDAHRLSKLINSNQKLARSLLEINALDHYHNSNAYDDTGSLAVNRDDISTSIFHCYDELIDEGNGNTTLETRKVSSKSCECKDCFNVRLKTSKKFFRDPKTTSKSEMREVNGQLRGLLKKPNRPTPGRANRVSFDETRNEFFEADYIILIREDCAYDEEDEEPCTCGEHELVRLCCEEGCQCNFPAVAPEDNRTPQSPKFAPPIEFVDEAALSPPDGYKDNALKNTLGGALSGHIFGAQHLQQLQVIQRLQQQRAAMLAARTNSKMLLPPTSVGSVSLNQQQQQIQDYSSTQQKNLLEKEVQGVCTECAECAECAAKQIQDAECQEDLTPLGVPTVALLPLHTSSPERRITQKEIIAGEERPKYVLQAQYKPSPAKSKKDKPLTVEAKNQRYFVETITMTTVTERRIVREATEDISATNVTKAESANEAATPPSLSNSPGITELKDDQEETPPPIPPKASSPTQISGILKGGKLWKQDSMSQSDDQNNTTSEDEGSSTRRSVRFITADTGIENDIDGHKSASNNDDGENQINELIPIKKHSTLFNNALRPNSAVRQLFPSATHHAPVLTSEALRAFDESKRAGCLVPHLPGSSDTDTIRRSMERNILRRSLIKKKAVKSDISLEERIKQLTCDIDEGDEDGQHENDDESLFKVNETEESKHQDSRVDGQNSQKLMNGNADKNFSPSSSISSSSSGSSAYKKMSDIFNRDKKQDKILEIEEHPIVIIPQECRCPAAPDLGIGMQVPVVHTQIHRTPPRQNEPKRQFLSTLAPLTACVVGNKDDLSSYYTLAAAHHGGQRQNNAQYADLNAAGDQLNLSENNDETRKVAPDVIAGTPGQEQQDELAVFAQQEANRTEKIKKRYTNDASNATSDDDEQNDYGFNKRPSVRGIKPKFSSTNEILQEMQEQLQQKMPSVTAGQALSKTIKNYTLPKQSSSGSTSKQTSQNPSPKNVPHSSIVSSQQQPQQETTQIPANAIAQQQTEQRTWSFYSSDGADQQRIPVEGGLQQAYYQTLPAGAMFRQTMIQHGQDESLMYAQNCHSVTSFGQQHYGHYARSPTRRPESPPPLRNYHQTMVLIPYNAETYSQFAATSIDPKVAHIQRQNILEYQQVTQQTIRVPIGYALPGMQLHVVAGRGHTAQYATAQNPQQRILAQRYQLAPDGSNMTVNYGERGVPEGAVTVAHNDCSGPTNSNTTTTIPVQQQTQQLQSPNCRHASDTDAMGGQQQDPIYYAKRKKRAVWCESAEGLLMELWAEKIDELRCGRKNSHIYVEMAERMSSAGFDISANEIKTKMKNFRRMFSEENKKVGPSGGTPSTWKWFDNLNGIIGSSKVFHLEDVIEESAS